MEYLYTFARNNIILWACIFITTSPYAQSDLIQIGGLEVNHYPVTITTSDNDGQQVGENLLSRQSIIPNLNAASRFLGQATFGADYELIEEVAQMGISTWLEEQLNRPYTFSYHDHVMDLTTRAIEECPITHPIDDGNICIMNTTPKYAYFGGAWITDAMVSEDLVRARVAFALSEIFVVSMQNDVLRYNALGLADYYDVLGTHAFGNFRDLLEAISLHPTMGTYLTFINNPKSDPTANIFPDENYAREIMQLFTIGLKKLNLDGTPQLDANGDEIPTYTNYHIQQLAKVFTGLTFGDATAFGEGRSDIHSFAEPMQMWNDWHEAGTKELIENYTIPDRNPVDGMADIQEALDHLFQHPNVGPFISKQLIQRLIKANPSPDYVARVAATFNDNGQGIRGDMKAVIRAILLDPEARGCSTTEEDEVGKLREPIIRYTHLLRAFNASTPSGEYRPRLDYFAVNTYQRPLAAPSVFNFFSFDFSPSGAISQAGKLAPEFQILDAKSSIGYVNEVQKWLFDRWRLLERFSSYFRDNQHPDYSAENYRGVLDLNDEIALAYDEDIGTMVERINLILAHGRLSYATKNTIIEAIRQLPDGWPTDARRDRVNLAIFLIMTAPEYLIFK